MKFTLLLILSTFCCLMSMSIMALDNQTSSSNAKERTLSIIKPDAVAAHHIGDIIARFEKSGLRISAIKMQKISKDQAKAFYAIHAERPFYEDLTTFMSSGPIVAMVLEGPNAVTKNREIMGATDFKKAEKGTLRADFAQSITKNAVHGSDSIENAKTEIAFFFTPNEIF
jgi:nucleoside-diphosphate kinase